MKTQKPTSRLCGKFLTTVILALTATLSARANYQGTVLADNPIAFYPINADVDPTGQTATDVSGNGNNGAYNGTDPEFNTVPGPSSFIPNALFFDGFTSFVDLSTGSNPTLLNFSNQITMEAWVQPASPTVGGSTPADILAKGYDGTNEMMLRANGGYYHGGAYNNSGGDHGASGGVESTNWVHLVCTFDGTNWNLYVNSLLVQSSADTAGALNFTDPWAIGVGTDIRSPVGDNSGTARFFTGNLTEVALYTNALTPAQVLNHFCVGEIGTTASSSVPIIIAQPQPQATVFGGTATFSVGVASALSTTNQWFKNNVAMAGQTNASLTITNAGVGDAVNYRVVVGNNNGTTNSVSVSLTVLAGHSLKWNSAGTTGVWDTTNTVDWLNLANSTQTNFTTLDQVLFDDTVGVSNNVIINGTVTPSLITVNSSTNNFTFNQGTSPLLSGNGNLVKSGSSLLTIYSPQGFSGAVKINGGTIYAGNNCFHQASSITITNNSSLDLGGGGFTSKPITVSGTGVNGNGAVMDSYGGGGQSMNITLAGDTLFGFPKRWDLGASSLVSGPHHLTLDPSADQVYPANQGAANPYFEWSANVGADVLGITLTNGIGLAVSNAAVAYMGLHQMQNAFQNPGTVVTVAPNCQIYFWDGGFNGSFHVASGGTVYLWTAPAAFNGSTVTLDDNAQWQSWNNSSDEPINSAIILNGVAHIVIGDHNMIYTNLISGSGGFVWDYWNHQMVLSAPNTYTGPTIIGSSGNNPVLALTNNGSISHSSLIFFGGNDPTVTHVDVSGRPDKTLTLASGQTLGGIGTINGSLVVASGATVSPSGTNTTIGITTGANATGTIAATNAVTLNGTTTLKLNGSGVNDQVQAGTGITFGGTLNLVNISGAPLAVGNSFQIFNAPSYTAGSYTITPAIPGAGLAWDTSQLNTFGTIGVVAAPSSPVVNSVVVSGGNLIFSGTNGTASGSYSVLTTTNLTTPIANWTPLVTNTFNAGAFSVTNAISTGTPQLFYRIKELP